MGMFKDLKGLQKASKGNTRPGLREGLRQANEAVQQVQGQQELAEHLGTNGIDGEATIKELRATGRQINLEPELELDLSVAAGGFTSDVTHVQPVSPALLGQLQPGATIAVKVDPEDHTKLILAG
jgi:hypothetical protein